MLNKKDNKAKDLIFKVLGNDTLLPFVMKKMNGISRNKAKNILSGGSISVDGQKVTQHDFELKPGMEVKIGRNQTGEPLKSHWYLVQLASHRRRDCARHSESIS